MGGKYSRDASHVTRTASTTAINHPEVVVGRVRMRRPLQGPGRRSIHTDLKKNLQRTYSPSREQDARHG